MLMLITTLALAQERTVTGTVTAKDDGMPIPGASVKLKGGAVATQTNASGAFSIKVTGDNPVLVISFIGSSSQEIRIGASNVVNASLTADKTQLGEVVVTALGIKRDRKSLGYSTTTVKGEDIANIPNQNLVNSLNGKVAGLQVISSGGAPGQASRIVIRGGNKSITGNNEPLFVVDGIIISNANDGSGANNEVEGFATPNRAADINPEDIENVTILKGSAASVLYGNRGSNGVVLITTKSGKSSNGKAVITFNSTYGTDNAIQLPEYQTEFAQGTNPATYREGTSRSFGPRITGQQVMSAAKGANVNLKVNDPRAEFLKTGTTINNNLSIAQSNEKSDFFLSIGQSNQNSIIPNQGFDKFNARLNATNRLSSKLTAGFNLGYNRSSGDVPFLGQSGSNPIFSLFHMPVSWDINDYGYERPDGRQINFRGGAFDNPLWTVNKTFFNTQSDRITGGFNFAYKPLDWLDFSYRLGNDYYIDQRRAFRDKRTGNKPNGFLEIDNVFRQELTSTFLININKKLTKDFNLGFIAGQDYNQRRLGNSTQTGTALTLPGIDNTNNVSAFDPAFEFRSKRRLIGAFGDLKLDYKNYLFLNLTARNEWSSTLPAENRSYFYPGANAAFVFSEAFNVAPNILSFGKIRVGFAKTARDAAPYSIFNTFSAGEFSDGFTDGITFPFGATPGFTVNNTINNPNLKPETTDEIEFGTELKFLDNRIGIDLTYFTNTNKDGIIEVDISPASGALNAFVNAGKTKASGIELGLNLVPVKSKDFRWDATVTFSRIRSKVLETYPGVDQIYLGGFSGNPSIFAVKGERYGSIIGSGYNRDSNGNVLVDDDGYPTFVDGINLGHTEADWTGGISNTFTYKGIGLNFLIDTRQGGFIYNGTEELLDFYGVSAKTASREDDFIFSGTNENSGSANNVVVKRNAAWWANAQSNEEYVYENNWVKFREINLNYTFKIKQMPLIRSLTIGGYGRNLFIWTDVPHVDPESSSFGTGNGQGATRFAFPTTRSFGVNLRASF